MTDFIEAAQLAEIPDPGRQLVEIADRLVVLFHVGGQVYALDDVCTHDGGPLGEGELKGYAVACPRHGAQFDIRDGKVLSMPATRPTISHQVKVQDGRVFVKLNDEEASANEESAAEAPGSAYRVAQLFASQQSINQQTAVAETATPLAAVPDISAQQSAPAAPSDSAISEDSAREALKQVIDPELFVNIVDLGLVYGVTLAPGADGKTDIAMEMTMTSPACPAGPQLLQNSRDALSRLPGVGQVEIKLVMIPPWTPDRMTEDARDQLGIF